jgi:hypothetical protein
MATFSKFSLTKSSLTRPNNAHIEYDPNATSAEFLRNPGKLLGFEEQMERDTKAIYFNIANSVIAGCLLIIGVVGKLITRATESKMGRVPPRRRVLLARMAAGKGTRTRGEVEPNHDVSLPEPFYYKEGPACSPYLSSC